MKTLIAVPCMDFVPTDFLVSFVSMNRPSEADFAFTHSSLVYDARNTLAQTAMDGDYDRVLWIDSDMTFESDAMIRLSHDLDGDRRVVGGLCFTRRNTKPVIYSEVGIRPSEDQKGKLEPYRTYMENYPRNTLFKVAGIGAGFLMMETSVIREVYEKFGPPFFPEIGFGEDLSFCRRCSQLGIDIWCDSRVRIGHIGQTVIDEATYIFGVKK